MTAHNFDPIWQCIKASWLGLTAYPAFMQGTGARNAPLPADQTR